MNAIVLRASSGKPWQTGRNRRRAGGVTGCQLHTGQRPVLSKRHRAGVMPATPNEELLARRASPNTTPEIPYYITLFFEAFEKAWSKTNPEGTILLSIAENHLSVDLLKAKLQETAEFPAYTLGYSDGSGLDQLKRAFVQILQSTFLKGHELDTNNLIISAGAGCILESLLFAILDPGDGVLIPSPHYAGYVFEIEFRVEGKIVPVYLDPDCDVYDTLTQAKEQSEANGVPIRALLVTHPDNPTGTIREESTLTVLATWCADHHIHLITNELYANSMFNEEPVQFKSLFTICKELGREELNHRIHLVYGLSKDFSGSGLRVAMLYTECEPLMTRLKTASHMLAVPFVLQHQLATVLSDSTFVQSFIQENKRRLKQNYDTLTGTPLTHPSIMTVHLGALEEAQIVYRKAQAGLFLVVDLRAALKQPDFESEKALCTSFAEQGVLLTPGAFVQL